MTDMETLGEHQAVADGLASAVHARIAEATPVQVLSDRGDKLLQVMQEADGSTFVTRSFTDNAVRYVESRRIDFDESWVAMHTIFTEAGLGVVRGHLLASNGDYSYVAVHEHLTDAQQVREASLETKKKLAESMATLTQRNRDGFLMAPEMLNRDMFVLVTGDGGEETVTLVDTDPHIYPTIMGLDTDVIMEFFIDKLAGLFWDEWCNPEERAEVCSALFMALDRHLDMTGEGFDIMSRAGIAMQNLHFMTNGMDLRQSNLLKF